MRTSTVPYTSGGPCWERAQLVLDVFVKVKRGLCVSGSVRTEATRFVLATFYIIVDSSWAYVTPRSPCPSIPYQMPGMCGTIDRFLVSFMLPDESASAHIPRPGMICEDEMTRCGFVGCTNRFVTASCRPPLLINNNSVCGAEKSKRTAERGLLCARASCPTDSY